MAKLKGLGTVPILASKVVGLFASFVNSLIVARSLGPEGRGDSAVAVSIIVLLPTILILGSSPLLRHRMASNPKVGEFLFRGVRWFALLGGLVTAFLIWPLGDVLLPGVTEEMLVAVTVSAPFCVTFGIIWISGSSILVARGKSLIYALVFVLPNTIPLLVVLGFLLAGKLSPDVVVWAQLFGYALTFVIVEMAVGVSFFERTATPWQVLVKGLPYAAGQVVGSLSFRLDQALMLMLVGSYFAGIYSVAATISLLPVAVGQALAAASFSALFKADSSKDQDVARWIRLTALASLVATVCMALVVPWGIPLLFGASYSAAVGPALVGLIGGLFLAIVQATTNLLVVRAKGWWMSLSSTAGLLVGIVLLFWMTPLIGIIGASIAAAVNALIVLSIQLIGCRLSLVELLPRSEDVRPISFKRRL